MLYLVLAILCSAAIGVLMRCSERRLQNRYVMFFTNYVICILMARLFMGSSAQILPEAEGLSAAILIGAFSGIMYLVSLAYSQWDYTVNGIIMSNTFSKLGVLVPITLSALVFKEVPTALQLGGLALAIAAIVIINTDSASGTVTEKGKKYKDGFLKLALVGHLLVSGITEALTNVFDKVGDPALKDNFLFFNFVFAMLTTLAVLLYQRKPFSRWDVLFGILVGIPNYMSARFLLYSLASLPSFVVFPVSCIGGIVMASLAGMLLFKEKLSRRKGIGLAIILAALLLLNL